METAQIDARHSRLYRPLHWESQNCWRKKKWDFFSQDRVGKLWMPTNGIHMWEYIDLCCEGGWPPLWLVLSADRKPCGAVQEKGPPTMPTCRIGQLPLQQIYNWIHSGNLPSTLSVWHTIFWPLIALCPTCHIHLQCHCYSHFTYHWEWSILIAIKSRLEQLLSIWYDSVCILHGGTDIVDVFSHLLHCVL